jgi:hypothetical protein
MKEIIKYCPCGEAYVIIYNPYGTSAEYSFLGMFTEVITCDHCGRDLTAEDLVDKDYFNKEVI